MAVSSHKTFSAGEVLTASDLNSSFSQVFDNGQDLGWPAAKAKDLDGQELILDGDGDTSITSDTDDQIDFRVGGADRLRITASATNVLSGVLQENGVGIRALIRRDAGLSIFKAQTGRAMAMDNAGNMTLFNQVYS